MPTTYSNGQLLKTTKEMYSPFGEPVWVCNWLPTLQVDMMRQPLLLSEGKPLCATLLKLNRIATSLTASLKIWTTNSKMDREYSISTTTLRSELNIFKATNSSKIFGMLRHILLLLSTNSFYQFSVLRNTRSMACSSTLRKTFLNGKYMLIDQVRGLKLCKFFQTNLSNKPVRVRTSLLIPMSSRKSAFTISRHNWPRWVSS